MTVRDMVRALQTEARTGDISPARAAQMLVELTALLGNCSEEIRHADHRYAVVLLTFLDSDEAANRAKIRAETSPEYLRKREARDTRELVIELVRSLKYLIKCAEEEMRLTR